MIDETAIINTYLRAQTALTTVLGGAYVYGGRLDVADQHPKGAPRYITFSTRGGSPLYMPVLNPSVQFQCFGEDEYSAKLVFRTMYDVLHNKAGVGFKSAVCEQLGQPLEDPDTGRPFVLTFFSFWMSN